MRYLLVLCLIISLNSCDENPNKSLIEKFTSESRSGKPTEDVTQDNPFIDNFSNDIILSSYTIKSDDGNAGLITELTQVLKYPNHDKEFYDFLPLVMPDWKERKRRLEKVFWRH
ncbi:MAG: M48 family metallopeptidase [bacterium]|nr:M48 family metallopeptidase [bacterium]